MNYFCHRSRDGHPGIKANLKAIQGDLFLLEKYIFFVSKSPLLVEIADIHQVVFSRVGASMGAAAARTFDLKIVTKSGAEHTFTSINKEEHESVDAYLKDKKIKIKTETVPDVDMILAAGVGDDDDEDDEDMRSIDSDDDGGRTRNKPSKKTAGSGDGDDDSEDDGTFNDSEAIIYIHMLTTPAIKQRILKHLILTRDHQVIVIQMIPEQQQHRMLAVT